MSQLPTLSILTARPFMLFPDINLPRGDYVAVETSLPQRPAEETNAHNSKPPIAALLRTLQPHSQRLFS
jgi:hypothetical protein